MSFGWAARQVELVDFLCGVYDYWSVLSADVATHAHDLTMFMLTLRYEACLVWTIPLDKIQRERHMVLRLLNRSTDLAVNYSGHYWHSSRRIRAVFADGIATRGSGRARGKLDWFDSSCDHVTDSN